MKKFDFTRDLQNNNPPPPPFFPKIEKLAKKT